MILPFSMYSNKDCCCFLLKDWISSRYSSTPLGAIKVSNCAVISRISAVEAVVAFSLYNVLLVCLAMILATVVFPVPLGP